MSSAFERLVGRLPYSWEKIVGMGISFFIREQDPQSVEFNVIAKDGNAVGWEINVYTDEENVEKAKDFWLEFVEGRL